MGAVAGVGIDLASVGEVRASMAAHGERYLSRLFTPAERARCSALGDPALGYAGLFAAKEAAIKALRPADGQPPWTDFEVGERLVSLSGAAARLAPAPALSFSLARDGDLVLAVVMAMCP